MPYGSTGTVSATTRSEGHDASIDPEDPHPVVDHPTRSLDARLPTLCRFVSHAGVWLAVGVATGEVLARGWTPIADDAGISFGAERTLTLHPPLVGFTTTATHSRVPLHDLGPLLFWLLALPVHVDPVHGVLWGAALIGGVVLSVAVEAMWSAGRPLGCLLVAFAALDYLWFVPQVMENLAWNAFFPIPFLIAGMALAWVVAVRSLGWWPVLVFVASVAAQSHLVYAPIMFALAVAAPVLGLADRGRPARSRWLVWGAVVGLLCWLAPLIQALGPNGNLAAVISNGGAREGLGLGLQAVARLGTLPPLWMHQEPINNINIVSTFLNTPRAMGVVVLLGLAAVGGLGWVRGRRALASLAFVTLASTVGVLFAFASIPRDNWFNISYVICVLWAVSVAVWTTGIWAVVAAAVALQRRWWPTPVRDRPSSAPIAPIATIAAMTILMVVAVVSAVSYDPAGAAEASFAVDRTAMATTAQMFADIQRSSPQGPVALAIAPVDPKDHLATLDVTDGLAWRLAAAGRRVGVNALLQPQTGQKAPRAATTFVFWLDHQQAIAMGSAYCAPVSGACIQRISDGIVAARARG